MSIFLGDENYFDNRYLINIIPQDNPTYNPNQTGSKVSKKLYINGMYASTEFSVRGGNTFDTLDSRSEGLVGALDKVKGIANAVSKAAGAVGIGVSAIPKRMTNLTWTGSEAPVFNVTIIFICTNSGLKEEAVIPKVNSIMKYVYPTSSFFPGLGRGAGLGAPANYNPLKKQGFVRLKLGQWFDAKDLVIESANFDFSKEVNREGSPIYAIGQVQLRPYQAITYDQYLNYFPLYNSEG